MQRSAVIAALALLSLISVTVPALAARDEATIQASYDEAIGRRAKPDEVKYWMGRQDWKTEQDLVNLHRIGIKSNQALADEVIVNSYRRVFNYTPLPGGGEITHWRQHAKLGWTCKEMMVEHEKLKKANPEQAKANAAMVNALRAKNMVID
jgi:hypothetical protein